MSASSSGKRLPVRVEATVKVTRPTPKAEAGHPKPAPVELYNPNLHRNRQQWERAREHDARRSASTQEPTTEREYVDWTTAKIREAADKYREALEGMGLKFDGLTEPQTQDQMGAMAVLNNMQVRRMAMAVVTPLRAGVNPVTVAESVGAFVMLQALSPEFREQITDPIKDRVFQGLSQMQEKRLEKKMGQAEQQAEFYREQTGEQIDAMEFLPEKWRRRAQLQLDRERGGRELFTPASAAITKVGMAEQAYAQMKADPSRAGAVYEGYQQMMQAFESHLEQDGLDPAEVERCAQLIVSDRMHTHPETAAVFAQTAYGRFRPGVEPGTGLVNAAGAPMGGHRLTLRKPMDKDAQSQITQSIAEVFHDAAADPDPQAGRRRLMEAMAGMAAVYAHDVRTRDTAEMPGPLGNWVETAERMQQGLYDDGLGPGKVRDLYSSAYVDAVDATMRNHPEMEAEMSGYLGANWRRELRKLVADPDNFKRGGVFDKDAGQRDSQGQYRQQSQEERPKDRGHGSQGPRRPRYDNQGSTQGPGEKKVPQFGFTPAGSHSKPAQQEAESDGPSFGG